jgi:hypothetical protein
VRNAGERPSQAFNFARVGPQQKINLLAGNSPEMMPWDCSLNNDLVKALMQHMSISSFTSSDEDKKFKLTTSKDVRQAHQKIMAWGGEVDKTWLGLYVPGPEQIKGDITKVFDSMQQIVIAGGYLVEKLGNQFEMGEGPRRLGPIGEGSVSKDLA